MACPASRPSAGPRPRAARRADRDAAAGRYYGDPDYRAPSASADLVDQGGPAAERTALRLAQARRALKTLERRRAILAEREWRSRQGIPD
jgi:hypothetical protein